MLLRVVSTLPAVYNILNLKKQEQDQRAVQAVAAQDGNRKRSSFHHQKQAL